MLTLSHFNNGCMECEDVTIALKSGENVYLQSTRTISDGSVVKLGCHFHYMNNILPSWNSDIMGQSQQFIVYDTQNFVEILWLLLDSDVWVGNIDDNRHIMKIYKYHKIPMINIQYIGETPHKKQ